VQFVLFVVSLFPSRLPVAGVHHYLAALVSAGPFSRRGIRLPSGSGRPMCRAGRVPKEGVRRAIAMLERPWETRRRTNARRTRANESCKRANERTRRANKRCKREIQTCASEIKPSKQQEQTGSQGPLSMRGRVKAAGHEGKSACSGARRAARASWLDQRGLAEERFGCRRCSHHFSQRPRCDSLRFAIYVRKR
jgi:hypothetical protein